MPRFHGSFSKTELPYTLTANSSRRKRATNFKWILGCPSQERDVSPSSPSTRQRRHAILFEFSQGLRASPSWFEETWNQLQNDNDNNLELLQNTTGHDNTLPPPKKQKKIHQRSEKTILRNRETAGKFRQRKKEYVQELEQQVILLREEKQELEQKVIILTEENNNLKLARAARRGS